MERAASDLDELAARARAVADARRAALDEQEAVWARTSADAAAISQAGGGLGAAGGTAAGASLADFFESVARGGGRGGEAKMAAGDEEEGE